MNDESFFRASDEDISSYDLATQKHDRRSNIDDLIQTIKETADKLSADGSTRGDLKILSRTLRELRYAFKVFAPYRRRRKVTVFGSARTPPDHPAYQQAVELGRVMAQEVEPQGQRDQARQVGGGAGVEHPRIGVQAPLVALGLNPDRTMEVPRQRGVAGWYQYSPAPGATGPAVIAGHVALRGAPDVFHRLVELQPGDHPLVRYDDGSVVTFEVYEVERHPKDAFPTERVYGRTDGPELRLITCGGEYDGAARSYRDNIIAFARAVAP